MREIRGRDIAMIFQEPMTSLNPVLTIGLQIDGAAARYTAAWTQAAARARAIELLKLVGIPEPERAARPVSAPVFRRHAPARDDRDRRSPCNPKLLIADEPTTALDVTIQAQILKLMKDLSRELGIALVMITHNLGIVARYADRVNVMYAARIAEQARGARDVRAPAASLYRRPVALGAAARPAARAKLETIEGMPPDLLDPPSGCRFAPRCPAQLPAARRSPPLDEIAPGIGRHACAAREMAQVGPAASVASAEPRPPRAEASMQTTPLLQRARFA